MAIVNGQAPDANEVLALNSIRQIYTGTGFNSTNGEASFELDAQTNVSDSNYAEVEITGTSTTVFSEITAGFVQLKAQIKETGQSYADIAAYAIVHDFNESNTFPETNVTSTTYKLVATLTAGMKTNGFQIKVFSNADLQGSSSSVSFTNIQTVQGVRA